MSFQEIDMKHNKLIGALAAAGGIFAMSGAHAIAPAVALGLAAIGGAAVGSAATHPNPPPTVAVLPPNSATTVVIGRPPSPVQEVIPAPREGFLWEPGRYEIHNGVSAWVPGHWVATDGVIYEHN